MSTEISHEAFKSDGGWRAGRGSWYLAASDRLPGDSGVGDAGPLHFALTGVSRFRRRLSVMTRWLGPGVLEKAGPLSEVISDSNLPVRR